MRIFVRQKEGSRSEKPIGSQSKINSYVNDHQPRLTRVNIMLIASDDCRCIILVDLNVVGETRIWAVHHPLSGIQYVVSEFDHFLIGKKLFGHTTRNGLSCLDKLDVCRTVKLQTCCIFLYGRLRMLESRVEMINVEISDRI